MSSYKNAAKLAVHHECRKKTRNYEVVSDKSKTRENMGPLQKEMQDLVNLDTEKSG